MRWGRRSTGENGQRRDYCHGNGGKTHGSAGGEGLDEAALVVGLDDLVNGVAALDDLELAGEALAGKREDAAARDAVEDEPVVERGRDELELGRVVL